MLQPVSLDLVKQAAAVFDDSVVRTPLVPFPDPPAGRRIYLKLENLQPIGSFKVRGAGAAMGLTGRERLSRGVYTASAGNWAQGLAWNARRLGVPCTAVVPEGAPRTKLDAIRRLGADIVAVPFERWWRTIEEHRYPGIPGHFIHPVSDPLVMAGNATIGLEILEDLPEVQAILAPYGGGGLSCGIASAVRALRPEVKVFGCEAETAAPLAAAWKAGRPVRIDHRPSFVDGIGGRSVLAEMWPLARDLLAGPIVVSIERVRAAVRRLLERNRILAEGAGAAPLAAALAAPQLDGTVVCVISGGNLDTSVLMEILASET